MTGSALNSISIHAAHGDPRLIASAAVVIGIVMAAGILGLTGYFTGTEYKPVKDVGATSLTGAATVILSGLAVGFESAVYTTLVIGAAVFCAFLLGSGSLVISLFAVSLAGCGLLTTVGVIVAMDTFGPVSDNAQGIAEMSGDVSEEGAQILTELDAVGNTTKAITKGIAIATAVLAATALFGSYATSVLEKLRETGSNGSELLDFFVFNPGVLVGVLLGAAVVFLFSGLAINAVGRAAGAVVFEVRRQFREIPGIMEGTGRPEYGRVVDIVTRDSLRELVTPGLLAVLAPIAVGFGLGVAPLAGFLGGAIGTGTLMAVFLANSGGAWDNAKKLVEDGHHGGKGSPAHEATIIGDTVGDPFKDTAGPAINPLIKVMNLVSLLIASAIVSMSVGADKNTPLRLVIALVAVAIIVVAVVISKRRSTVISDEAPAPAEAARLVRRPGSLLHVVRRRPGSSCTPGVHELPGQRVSAYINPPASGGWGDVRWRRRLRDGLLAAGFGYDAVVEVLGRAGARGAVAQRDRTRAAGDHRRQRRRDADAAVAAAGRRCPSAAVEQALPGLLDDLCAAGVLEQASGQVRALLDVRPYATDDTDLWVVSDLTPGLDGRPARVATDHVLGISPAATSLAQITVRDQVGTALDLGTGCGVQSLHLAAARRTGRGHRREPARPRADPVQPRPQRRHGVEVREGSLFEPVAGERFDLVATNPPFVISPATSERLVYRDSGLPGDEVVERIVRGVPAHLRPGGVAQVLANWAIARDQPVGRAAVRLGHRLRRVGGPARGARPAGVRRALAQGRRAAPVDRRHGGGLRPALRRVARVVRGAGRGGRRVRLDHPARDRGAARAPAGGVALRHRAAAGRRDRGVPAPGRGACATSPTTSSSQSRLVARSDVRQETYGAPGAADPEQVVLRQQRWMRRARQADTVEAALVGACDGELTLAQILDALGQLLASTDDLRATYLPVVRDLVAEGFLEPPG